jgi:UDPglucose--hexose-1-phosphate uridylyltransferase
MDKSEMRLDPLRENWTIFSSDRLHAPPFLARRRSRLAGERFSPFSTGHEDLAPHTLYSQPANGPWQVRVIPNRVPAVRVEGDPLRHPDGFYDRTEGVGAHEVIIETPGAEPLEALPLSAIGEVIVAWKSRMLDLMRDGRMRAFFIVKEVGEQAGATVPHAVSQLIALAILPPTLVRKLEVSRDFYERKKRSIFEDIWREEVRAGTRLVYENNGFAVFCPYASRTPFEMAVYPKRQCADFHGISDPEVQQLADALKTLLGKLSGALNRPPYHLMLYTAPTLTTRRDHWNTLQSDFRWHIEIVPALYYTGGFEAATGCYLNPVFPETAAAYLRKITV